MALVRAFPRMVMRGACRAAILLGHSNVVAHCDTVDGPVVLEARSALRKGDVMPVLKWVEEDRGKEVRQAFNEAIKSRSGSKSSQERAETLFFETLVRVHRSGEGEPFTGLKPSGSADPVFAAADKALTDGSGDDLSNEIAASVRDGLRQCFAEVLEKKKHADESIEAGRAYAAAYVAYTHYIEAIHAITLGDPDKVKRLHAGDGGHGH